MREAKQLKIQDYITESGKWVVREKERKSRISLKREIIGKILRRKIMDKPNIKKILKNTGNFREGLIEDLKDPDEALSFLEVILEGYQEDKDERILMMALGDIAKAQGGIGKLAKRLKISRPHLYEILAGKHSPRLDNTLDIISGLGFKVRLETA